MTLHRAIVCLPSYLLPLGSTQQEQVVFFESTQHGAYHRLEQLADTIWRVASSCWGDLCFVEELFCEANLIHNATGGPETGDLRLLEVGLPFLENRGVRYCRAEDAALFVSPSTRARLMAALIAAERLDGRTP